MEIVAKLSRLLLNNLIPISFLFESEELVDKVIILIVCDKYKVDWLWITVLLSLIKSIVSSKI